jgi:hypothetical protein
MATDTCSAVRDDVVMAYGENHDFVLSFETDRPMTGAMCTLTIKTNNSSLVDVYRAQQPIVNKACSFVITPAQCRLIGEGQYWYDIWMIDGQDFEKPLVMGNFTIPMLSTRSQS